MVSDHIAQLQEKLAELKQEHSDLNTAIDRMMQTQPIDFLAMQRMKKRKLLLKDMIQKVENELIPDIIA
ncbi:MAG: hypothetical protein CMH30_08535 [Micavibrio sp.]|nr:hypothetical protein [Micavibrio sp.]|tara:strand:- start:264 stop:470 length:207 start_codon:yes stop_codon:yes gene_type:complete